MTSRHDFIVVHGAGATEAFDTFHFQATAEACAARLRAGGTRVFWSGRIIDHEAPAFVAELLRAAQSEAA